MSKEPGQMAYEKSRPSWLWCEISVSERKIWAAVEAAIRADQSAKVWEEAAKVVEGMIDKEAFDLGDRADMALLDAAAALRAKIGAEHG